MPGVGGQYRFQFTDGEPLAVKIVFSVFFGNFVLWFATGVWAERFAPLHSTNPNFVPANFKFGVVRFIPPLVDLYLDWGLWIHFCLLGCLALTTWYYVKRGRTERVR